MGAKTLLSLEEFLALPDDDANLYELNDGELVVIPAPKAIHTRLVYRIQVILIKYVTETNIGEVYSEASYVLSREPESTVRRPDVSFLSTSRARGSGEYLEGSPELAVEIVSPSEPAEELNVKIKQYLKYGSREVWVFYPKTRSVYVHRPGEPVLDLSESDTLTSGLFPGWSARVSDLFDLR